MELHNAVLLLKTAWRFLMERVQFLKAKSRVGGDAIAYALSLDKSWSYSWRCLVTAFRSFFGGLKRRIGDGNTIAFWQDVWEPLMNEQSFKYRRDNES